MALLTPSLPELVTMDASKDTTIIFKTASSHHTGYRLVIYKKSTGETIKEQDITSSENKITIQAGTLQNGTDYLLTIRIIRGNNIEVSDWSEYCTLVCYSTPICSIDNIESIDGENVVQDQNYLFEGTYSQYESIKLQSYHFVLYNKNNEVLQVFEKHYPRNASTQVICTQKVEGLETETKYYIELVCVDKYEKETKSTRYEFVARYDKPRFTQFVEIENEESTASVKMEASMIQILFVTDKEAVFINSSEIDLRDNRAYNKIYGDGSTRLNITGDFTLKIYCRNIPHTVSGEEKYFLTLTSGDGKTKIKMKEMDNRIHVYKVMTFENSNFPLSSHYASDVISGYVQNSSSLVIQINQTGGRLDVYAQVV